MLGMPAPRVRVYARETAVAEKLQAMVDLGMANSRMKDFYDLWFLSSTFKFERERLHAAISATFQRRASAIPATLPVALTKTFADNAAKRTQWSAFISRARVADTTLGLPDVIDRLATFAGPLFAESQVADGSTWDSILDGLASRLIRGRFSSSRAWSSSPR